MNAGPKTPTGRGQPLLISNGPATPSDELPLTPTHLAQQNGCACHERPHLPTRGTTNAPDRSCRVRLLLATAAGHAETIQSGPQNLPHVAATSGACVGLRRTDYAISASEELTYSTKLRQ